MQNIQLYRNRQGTYEAGLGAAFTMPPQTVANIQAATQVINSASGLIPQQSIQIQTEFSKVANTVASVAATVAAVAAVVPGVGTVVAVVAGVVAAAAALLGKIFSRARAKELDAERKQYDIVNAELRAQNADLDLKYENLKANMATMREEISKFTGIDFTFGKDQSSKGLGLCIFNCKKKAAEQQLNTAKDLYKTLSDAQATKIKLIQELLKEWDILTKAVIELRTKGTINTGLLVAIGLAGAFGIYKLTQ